MKVMKIISLNMTATTEENIKFAKKKLKYGLIDVKDVYNYELGARNWEK